MNGARAFLSQLKACGIDYIFANPGSEFIPLIEEYAKGGEFPRAVTVPHESLAVSMAHGYYLATGRPQAVMVHVTVGTGNALIGLIGAHHMNIPILFFGGRTPVKEQGGNGSRDRFVHWAQEAYDQGAIAREFCKWSYELRDIRQAGEACKRAYEIMMEGARGPVQLMFSREIFYQDAGEFIPSRPAEQAAVLSDFKMPENFERGLVITCRSGLVEESVEALEEFCERYQLGVLTPQAQAVNIHASHPCYLGFENRRALEEADLILVLDTDVPWMPHLQKPPERARIVHISPDPHFRRIPMRSFRSDLNVTADVTLWLKSQNTGKRRKASPWLAGLREEFTSRRRSSLDFESSELNGQAIARALCSRPGLTIFNELSLPAEQISFNSPGSYFRSGSASALGWAMGAAVGFKAAQPASLPVAVVGDGVYYLSNPLAAHWLAQKHPTLTIVLNNQGMKSVHANPHFTDLSPTFDFGAISRAAGGFGAKVSAATEFDQALEQGISSLRAGQWGVIDARLGQ